MADPPTSWEENKGLEAESTKWGFLWTVVLAHRWICGTESRLRAGPCRPPAGPPAALPVTASWTAGSGQPRVGSPSGDWRGVAPRLGVGSGLAHSGRQP